MKIKTFNEVGWEILIIYDCTCEDIDSIIEALKEINCPKKYINEALDNLETCNLNIGLTYSNLQIKSSIIIINKTSSIKEFINTLSHEIFHLTCHIAKSLELKDEEEWANLNGNLNSNSANIIENFIKSRLQR